MLSDKIKHSKRLRIDLFDISHIRKLLCSFHNFELACASQIELYDEGLSLFLDVSQHGLLVYGELEAIDSHSTYVDEIAFPYAIQYQEKIVDEFLAISKISICILQNTTALHKVHGFCMIPLMHQRAKPNLRIYPYLTPSIYVMTILFTICHINSCHYVPKSLSQNFNNYWDNPVEEWFEFDT